MYNMYIISVGRRIFNVKIYQEVYYEKKEIWQFLLTMGMAFSMLAGCGSSSQTDSASDTTSGSAAESAAETEAESASDEEAAGEKKTLTVWG